VSLKAISAALALLVSSCALLSSGGPTEVARGEYYAAGKAEYDAFFIQLHQLQVELLNAPNEPRRVRESLTKAAGLTPDASDETLRNRLSQELTSLASRGLRARLEVPEPSTALDASATLHTSESSVASALRTNLPRDATRLVRSRNRMLLAKEQLEKLRVRCVLLDAQVDSAFRSEGPWKRDEVRRNLSDAQKVMTLMTSRAQEVQQRDQDLLKLVASAVTTDANLGKAPAYAPPTSEEVAPVQPRKRSAPGRSHSKPAAAAESAPAAKPAPSRPKIDDEGALPKPVQGSAPAEIEP
jgi:hypothetical protein